MTVLCLLHLNMTPVGLPLECNPSIQGGIDFGHICVPKRACFRSRVWVATKKEDEWPQHLSLTCVRPRCTSLHTRCLDYLPARGNREANVKISHFLSINIFVPPRSFRQPLIACSILLSARNKPACSKTCAQSSRGRAREKLKSEKQPALNGYA